MQKEKKHRISLKCMHIPPWFIHFKMLQVQKNNRGCAINILADLLIQVQKCTLQALQFHLSKELAPELNDFALAKYPQSHASKM